MIKRASSLREEMSSTSRDSIQQVRALCRRFTHPSWRRRHEDTNDMTAASSPALQSSAVESNNDDVSFLNTSVDEDITPGVILASPLPTASTVTHRLIQRARTVAVREVPNGENQVQRRQSLYSATPRSSTSDPTSLSLPTRRRTSVRRMMRRPPLHVDTYEEILEFTEGTIPLITETPLLPSHIVALGAVPENPHVAHASLNAQTRRIPDHAVHALPGAAFRGPTLIETRPHSVHIPVDYDISPLLSELRRTGSITAATVTRPYSATFEAPLPPPTRPAEDSVYAEWLADARREQQLRANVHRATDAYNPWMASTLEEDLPDLIPPSATPSPTFSASSVDSTSSTYRTLRSSPESSLRSPVIHLVRADEEEEDVLPHSPGSDGRVKRRSWHHPSPKLALTLSPKWRPRSFFPSESYARTLDLFL